jgi:hypothetical protein
MSPPPRSRPITLERRAAPASPALMRPPTAYQRRIDDLSLVLRPGYRRFIVLFAVFLFLTYQALKLYQLAPAAGGFDRVVRFRPSAPTHGFVLFFYVVCAGVCLAASVLYSRKLNVDPNSDSSPATNAESLTDTDRVQIDAYLASLEPAEPPPPHKAPSDSIPSDSAASASAQVYVDYDEEVVIRITDAFDQIPIRFRITTTESPEGLNSWEIWVTPDQQQSAASCIADVVNQLDEERAPFKCPKCGRGMLPFHGPDDDPPECLTFVCRACGTIRIALGVSGKEAGPT